MSADSTLNAFVAQGTTTQRLAFTPTPPTPASGSPLGYMFWDHTLQQMFAYDTTSAGWVAVASVAGTGVTGTGLTSGLAVVGAGGRAITVAANSVVLLHSLTTLTDAQVKALPTTGIQVIPALGSGFRAKFLGVSLLTKFTSGAYTNVNATYADWSLKTNSDLSYALYGLIINDSSQTPVVSQVTHSLGAVAEIIDINATSVTAINNPGNTEYIISDSNTQAGIAFSAWDNMPITIKMDNNGSGNLTGGNAANTLKVTIYYSVEAL